MIYVPKMYLQVCNFQWENCMFLVFTDSIWNTFVNSDLHTVLYSIIYNLSHKYVIRFKFRKSSFRKMLEHVRTEYEEVFFYARKNKQTILFSLSF